VAWTEAELAEADRLLAAVLPAWNAPDRPVSLNPLGAEVDAALDARDLPRFRQAVAAFLAAATATEDAE
jgi:hypothetical protein